VQELVGVGRYINYNDWAFGNCFFFFCLWWFGL